MDDNILTYSDSNVAMNKGDLVYNSDATRKHDIDLDTKGIPKRHKIEAEDQQDRDLENDLEKFRMQRLEESRQRIYIPPMAKANLQARDDALFPLMEKALEFLTGDRQVFLVLGDSGVGKSTFNLELEHMLWRDYKVDGPIPLSINLPYIDNPAQHLIEKQLQYYNFSNEQIQHMKHHRQFILICDGYDESQLTVNLYSTNRLNQESHWRAKMVVSCRSQFLGSSYLDRFTPRLSAHGQQPILDHFQEAVIAPFSVQQVEEYVIRYVPLEPRLWVTEDYMRMLTTIPNLMDLAKNPFLLTLALETLPAITEGIQDLSGVKITRVQLYDIFVVHWLEVNKRRLESNILSDHDRVAYDQLLDAGFISMGIEYSTKLATAIFDKQDGSLVVQYIDSKHNNSWKAEFFGADPIRKLLLESSPLVRTGNYFQFLHRSILEYFYSRVIYSPPNSIDTFVPQDETPSTSADLLDLNNPLFLRNLVPESSIIYFLCDRVKLNPDFEHQLHNIVYQSKTDSNVITAASNAITTLVKAGISFNGADLRGIKIPGADLSSGQFDSAQIQGADLKGVNLSRSWLRQANMSSTQLEGVRFEELPYLEMDCAVRAFAYSPDGRTLGVTGGRGVNIYDASTWTRIHQLDGHKGGVFCVTYSQDSKRLVSGSQDSTVRLWDTTSGMELLVIHGHTGYVRSVAFSKCDGRIASGSDDMTLRIWDAQTGECVSILEGQTWLILDVKFSSDGHQLVSASMDGTIRFWDPETGESGIILSPNMGPVYSLAYSHDGKWIALGHGNGDVRLWDAVCGEVGPVLRGHTRAVTGVAFSPSNQWIASSSADGTTRLWSASTSTVVSVFTGHKTNVNGIAFSPNGLQLASGGFDGRVQLLEVNASWSDVEPREQLSPVWDVAYSNDGNAVLVRSKRTVQQWDSLTGMPGSLLCEISQPLSVTSKAFSPDKKQIAAGTVDCSIRLSSLCDGQEGPVLEGHSGWIEALVYSDCGRWLASCSKDKTIRLWELGDLELRHALAETGSDLGDEGCSLAFSPTGDRLAVGYSSGTVRLFDPHSRMLLLARNLATSEVKALAYSPNGEQLAIGTQANLIYLWNFHSNIPIIDLEGHGKSISCITYSSCGRWITSSSDDNTVRLWHQQKPPGGAESWSCTSVVRGFHGLVHNIVWSPITPKEFVTGCQDGSVRLWRVCSENGSVVVKLVWGSSPGALCAVDMILKEATGLNSTQLKLLVQRGAIDDSSRV